MFQSVRKNRRTTSSMISKDARRSDQGDPEASMNQRTASAPTCSNAASGSITFPRRFDIFRPSASMTRPWQITLRYADPPNSRTPSAMSE